MSAKKITGDKIIDLIKEEAHVIKRKREIFSELKKMNAELKELNEVRGIAGTFGFSSPVDAMNKSGKGTGFQTAPNISYVAQLEKELGGFGDEFSQKGINEATLEALRQENEQLKKQLGEMVKTNEAVSPVK